MFFTNRQVPLGIKYFGKRLKYPILGETKDADGSTWYVREIRDTKHGFDLLFGSPVSRLEMCPTGLPRLIPSQALKDFWEEHKTERNGIIYDLPAGRTTLKRARSRLGFHSGNDVARFWKLRLYDLRKLSTREFAARHNVSVDRVVETRYKLLGRQARELGWWREPEVLKVLLSDITLREKGEKLGIGTSHALRLSRRARKEQQA